jgi:hypothetical protein
MIKPSDVLPGGRHVAALASFAYLPLVFVLVARGAVAAESEVSPLEIFDQDLGAERCRDVLRIVALRALQSIVAAVQRVPGLTVIEVVEAHVPADGDEVLAIMIRVTLGAMSVRRAFLEQRRMEPAVFRDPLANLGVT